MSALPLKAENAQLLCEVYFVPITEFARYVHFAPDDGHNGDHLNGQFKLNAEFRIRRH
jgi:hypothetical protein